MCDCRYLLSACSALSMWSLREVSAAANSEGTSLRSQDSDPPWIPRVVTLAHYLPSGLHTRLELRAPEGETWRAEL